MEMLEYFFTCSFSYNSSYEELDDAIKKFKKNKTSAHHLRFITELHHIIQTKNYASASKIIEKTGAWSFKNHLERFEKLLNYIYDCLLDRPTTVKGVDFLTDFKLIPCPSCCPDIEKEDLERIIVIEKATITKNNMLVYVCKPCSIIWLTEDISLDKAHDFKKYMKSIGLHGWWKELHDRDVY